MSTQLSTTNPYIAPLIAKPKTFTERQERIYNVRATTEVKWSLVVTGQKNRILKAVSNAEPGFWEPTLWAGSADMAKLAHHGLIDEAEAIDALLDAAKWSGLESGQQPDCDDEILAVIDRGWDHGLEQGCSEDFLEGLGLLNGLPKPPVVHKPDAPATFSRGERKLKFTSGAEIKMKRTKWMWKGRIAMGSLALLSGPPGLGKSTMAYWIGAQVTIGNLNGEFYGQPKDVMVLATEDSWEFTILPRLIAAGADRNRCYRIEPPEGEAGSPAKLHNEVDRAILTEMAGVLDIGLLILDPLITHIGDKDSYKDAEVRTVLEPIVALADKCGFAIVGIIHNNKSGKTDPLNLVMGSAAFGAVARSVHSVIWDPEDETHTRRLFGTVKNNLGKMSGPGKDNLDTWVFDTETVVMETEDDDPEPLITSKVRFLGDYDKTIEDALVIKAGNDRQSSNGGNKETKLEAATTWLISLLERNGGKMKKSEIIDSAGNDMMSSHSEATLRRAIKQDDFETHRTDVAWWGLAGAFDNEEN